MALTFTQIMRAKIDQQNMTIYTAAMDTSYPTGGEAITANNVGLSTISALIPCGTPGGYGAEWVPSTGKLKMYFADYDAVADGALVEVDDETDLDGVVATLIAIGI